ADYRLAHALAADYFDRVIKRDKGRRSKVEGRSSDATPATRDPRTPSLLTILELGPGNGNLAASFLSHLRQLDTDGRIYPRVRYVLVDKHAAVLETAVAHPDLAQHRDRIETLHADVEDLKSVKDSSVDRIVCNELWNDLPTKLMLRKDGEIEEEFLRPNLSETRQAEIEDWSGFIHAFEAKDIDALRKFPAFLEDVIWEKDYRKTEWKTVPYRKTIVEFLKKIDEQVLVPVNLGAFATAKEARRLLAPDAIGFSSFDAGTTDMKVLNDPEKPCYGQFGGQYNFMVNFALVEAVARHLGFQTSEVEAQKDFVGRSLGTTVMSLMDLLATHPRAASLNGWEQDRLIIKTVHAVNGSYHGPYKRKIEFPLSKEMPAEEREALQAVLESLKEDGVPDTVAYLTEEEVFAAMPDLEALGYDREMIRMALLAPPPPVDYYHQFLRP
ncbi:MAG: hypothetical protein C4293_10140, partial [Nitrospiraceae bacterium]